MAAVYKRGDAWYLDYRDAHGRQRRSLGDITKKEAEAALAAKEYELRTGHNLTAAHNSAPQFALFAERSEEHTSALQSLMRISYAVLCLHKKIFNHLHIT